MTEKTIPEMVAELREAWESDDDNNVFAWRSLLALVRDYFPTLLDYIAAQDAHIETQAQHIEAQNAEIERLREGRVCEWKWAKSKIYKLTSCGMEYWHNDYDEIPYCPYCGGRIEEEGGDDEV